MFKVLRFAPVLLCACATSFVGSEAEVPTQDPTPGEGVIVASATVLLDEAPGVLDLQVGTDQIILDTDGTALEVEVGSVVVGKRDGGYLRRVSEVVEQGDRIVLRTVGADLSDAILHGIYHAEAEILDRAATTWDIGGRVLHDGPVWSSAEGDYVDVNVFIAEGAQVTIDPDFDFDIELFNGNWIDAGFAGFVELDYSADFVANVDGAYDNALEGQLISRTIPFAFELGPVPVVGTVTVDIIAGLEGDFDVQGTSTLHTEANAWAMLDAGYNDDGWYFDHGGDINGDLHFTDTSVQQSVATRAWMRAELTVELYSAAGAEITVNPWLEANTCDPLGLDVDGGVDGTHRYYFEALGWLDFDSGVHDFEFGPYDIYSYDCENGF